MRTKKIQTKKQTQRHKDKGHSLILRTLIPNVQVRKVTVVDTTVLTSTQTAGLSKFTPKEGTGRREFLEEENPAAPHLSSHGPLLLLPNTHTYLHSSEVPTKNCRWLPGFTRIKWVATAATDLQQPPKGVRVEIRSEATAVQEKLAERHSDSYFQNNIAGAQRLASLPIWKSTKIINSDTCPWLAASLCQNACLTVRNPLKSCIHWP